MLFSSFKQQKQFALVFVTFFAVFLTHIPTHAHEYWIEPEKFEIKSGEDIKANLRNGENYKGNNLYYLSGRFSKFEVHNQSGFSEVKGKEGDQPALNQKAEKDGLHILSYQSTFDRITFVKFEKFNQYLENQGLTGIAARHKQRGLPDTYFTEQYARAVKALVKVGDGKGKDTKTGLIFEFVALKNPYELNADTDTLPVRLYWDGRSKPNTQVLVFQKNAELTQTKLMTDENGEVNVPLKGGGKFMLSAVHMYDGDNDPETELAEWVSFWANLVFATSDADDILNASE